MLTFNYAQKEELNKIKKLILSDGTFKNIHDCCEKVAMFLNEKIFPYFYASVLMFQRGRFDDGMALLEKHKQNNVFVNVLYNYLLKYGKFEPATVVFEKSAPYDAWIKSNLFEKVFKSNLSVLERFIKVNPPPSLDLVTILDIGTGNGVLIAAMVNKILETYSIKKVRLILVDQSAEMLEASKKYCHANIRTYLDIITVHSKVQDISREDAEKALRNYYPIWFINSSLSIHHFPWEIKIPVLKTFSELSKTCFICECNFNHDTPEQNDPELIYSVYINYNFLMRDVMESPGINEDEKVMVNEQFFLAEAINILNKSRLERIDYHTKISSWKNLALRGGYDIVSVTPTALDEGKIMYFCMTFESAPSKGKCN